MKKFEVNDRVFYVVDGSQGTVFEVGNNIIKVKFDSGIIGNFNEDGQIPFSKFPLIKHMFPELNDEDQNFAVKTEQGVKHDQEKSRLELLSSTWIEGVGDVLAFGARKYEADNWRKGISQRRLMGAALRHVFAYLRGEDLDKETGLSHLLHASCCLMFAFELRITKPELDDRYKI